MAANVNLGQSVWNADGIINPVTTLRNVGIATIDQHATKSVLGELLKVNALSDLMFFITM